MISSTHKLPTHTIGQEEVLLHSVVVPNHADWCLYEGKRERFRYKVRENSLVKTEAEIREVAGARAC